MMKILSYKDCNKQIRTRGNGNIQSHNQEESKLNSTINVNVVLIHLHMTK